MSLEIEKTNRTPQVLFDSARGKFLLKGTMMPNNTNDFFLKLYTFAEVYLMNPNPNTHLEIELDYFNTISSWKLHEFIRLFDENKGNNTNVTLLWKYEADDHDMLEAGEMFASIFANIKFNLVETKVVNSTIAN